MKNLAATLVTLIMVSFALCYAYQVFRGRVRPALSTWLIMLAGTSLSLITYLFASGGDIKSGILNLADVLAVIIIVASTLLWSKTKVKFRSFEKWYLAGAAGITLFWVYSKEPFISNLLVQLLIWIGYFPTIQKLIIEKVNTESFPAWGIALSAGIIAIYPAVLTGNILSLIYVLRTIIMISIIFSLMYYYERREKQVS